MNDRSLAGCPPQAAWLADYGFQGESRGLGAGTVFFLKAAANSFWERAACFLGPQEMAVWPRKNPVRRQQWLLGRMAAKLAVAHLLGWDINGPGQMLKGAANLEILPDPLSGAPVLAWAGGADADAAWRKGIYLSVSHTGLPDGSQLASGLAAAGACPGLDLERRNRELSVRFLSYVYNRQEISLWPADDRRAPLWAWCAKEAASKAVRTGLVSCVDRFTLVSLAADLAWAEIRCALEGGARVIRANLFEACGCLGAWALGEAVEVEQFNKASLGRI